MDLSFLDILYGEGNGNQLQCSCLENPMDGEAWWPAVNGVAPSQTRLKRLSSSSGSSSKEPGGCGTWKHDLLPCRCTSVFSSSIWNARCALLTLQGQGVPIRYVYCVPLVREQSHKKLRDVGLFVWTSTHPRGQSFHNWQSPFQVLHALEAVSLYQKRKAAPVTTPDGNAGERRGQNRRGAGDCFLLMSS